MARKLNLPMEQSKHWVTKPRNRKDKTSDNPKAKNNKLILLFAFCTLVAGSYAQNPPFAKGRALYDAGRFEEAVSEYRTVLDSLLNCCESTEKVAIDSVNIHLGKALYSLAKVYAAEEKHEKALETGLEAERVNRHVLGEAHRDYFISLHNLATYYSAVNDYEKAIEKGKEVIELRRRFEPKHPYLALSLSNLAIDYSNIKNYEAAIKAAEEAAGMQRELPGELHSYENTLGNLASYYDKNMNYPKAVETAVEWLSVRLKLYGENSDKHRDALWNLGYYYGWWNTEYDNAIEATQKAAEITERNNGKENKEYAILLNNLSHYYSQKGDAANTLKYGAEALDIRRRIFSGNHEVLVGTLESFGDRCRVVGQFHEAEQLLKEALDISYKNWGEKSEEYAFCCFYLLRNYTGWNKKLVEAIEYGEKAVSILKEIEGENTGYYTFWLRNLALAYLKIGNYNRALEIATRASEIYEKTGGEKKPDYISNLRELSTIYNQLKNYGKAIELGTQALELAREVSGEKSSRYTEVLHQLALSYRDSGNIEKAIELAESLLPIYEETIGKKTNSYSTTVHSLSNYYYNLGIEIEESKNSDPEPYYQKSLSYAKEAVDIRRELLGENHSDFASALHHLSNAYAITKDYDNGAKYRKQVMDIHVNNIIDNFRDMTSSEREAFWNNSQIPFQALNIFCYRSEGHKMWQEMAYDAAIFVKGLLLNSEIDLANLLLESGDKEVIDQYNKLKMARDELRYLYSATSEKQRPRIISLEKEIAGMERELVRKSKTYGDYTRNLSMHWQDVRDALKDDEVAIEFIEIKDQIYTAMLLKKDSEYPRMIHLFTRAQLDTLRLEGSPLRFKEALAYETGMSKDFIYSTKALGELVWSPLKKHLSGIKHIYFSPSGIFHRIAIEYLPMNDGNIYDTFSLHRLSSTKQLAQREEDGKRLKSVLYGGLNYDAGSFEDAQPGNATASVADTYAANMLRSSGISATHLPGTEKEVGSIYNALSDKQMEISVYTGETGTETSFKSLSGKKINLLHIATHGFYLTEEQSGKQMQFLTAGLDDAPAEEDKTLSRSGLLMSGANIKLKGQEQLPEGADDGILTAREIANLDLRGLDMVVLSACQTGLGEVTGEGVFGLQRGFKKAGAQTIIMSLWNVSDRATEIIMSRFYQNMAEGQSKYEAFINAQAYLKQYEYEVQEREGVGYLRNRKTVTRKVKFDNPKYWAAFILLD